MDELQLARKLVSFDTVDSKPSVIPFLQKTLRTKGVRTKLVKTKGITSLLAFKGKGRPMLMLNGHYDTVPAGKGWKTKPLNPVVRQGKLIGLGSADMKSALAAMVCAFLEAKPGKGTLVLAAVGDEEKGGFRGSSPLAQALKPDFVIIGEPTSLDLALGHKAVLQLEIQLTGKAVHASRPGEGENAITAAARLLQALETHFPLPHGTDEEVFEEVSMNVGTISGGRATNVVADACAFTLDFRLPPNLKHEYVLAIVKRLASEYDAEVKVTEREPGFLEPGDSPLAGAAREELGRVRKFREVKKLGATDARFFAAKGAQAIIAGCGDPHVIHAANEFVPLREVAQAKRFYQGLVAKLLAR